MRDESTNMLQDYLPKVIISATNITKSRNKERQMLPHTLEQTKKL